MVSRLQVFRFSGVCFTPFSTSVRLSGPCYQNQLRCVATQRQQSVIQIPQQMAEKMRRAKLKEKKNERETFLQKSRGGNKSIPIIKCKREQFNYYLGQSYNKFEEVPLASKGWRHRKSAGDHFTIHGYGRNPAFAKLQEGLQEDFDSLGLSRELLTGIWNLGYKTPTNIQSLAIPHVLEGKNTLIAAETGNGKTLAFLAPMLQQIAQHKKAFRDNYPVNSPLGLVIVPGRELAEQIQTVASSLAEGLGINVELVKGGRTKKKMLNPTLTKPHLLVATVGALSKLTTIGQYDMSLVRHITLDEADSLLDDSFNDSVTRYVSRFPIQSCIDTKEPEPLAMSGVQLTLVSATTPRSLKTILDPIVDMDSVVRISTPYLHHIMPHIPQKFIRINHLTKAEKLLELAKNDAKKGVPFIVFSNSSKTSDWVSLYLNENDIPCVNLNGNMAAAVRDGRFEAFQSGQALGLSCTDLTSRGLDTVRAGHIINFEFPKYMADYIHRCGRTGRVGSHITGHVTNFVHRPQEVELVQKIEYAARKREDLPNVNANIKRIILSKAVSEEMPIV
ncbi:probable ATP-dependent RNA helicase DDX28 [Penaeus japonicus]|uniref:probable ATP-dependent RNA helicase DDX28 n=1 Tax=Penaeus japonicus TaxID=27405 RepID=UPI001C70D710|nr:probable ATP-dependent RNA helicase DDX28 [Penaeus japonicus]